MELTNQQLAVRRPVWEVLSDLFLDTDVSLSRTWRASQLAASPYSIAELELVLVEEVYPICKYNLMSVAGEWAGFDLDLLERTIVTRLRSPYIKALQFVNPGRFTVHLSVKWRATKMAVAALRDHRSEAERPSV